MRKVLEQPTTSTHLAAATWLERERIHELRVQEWLGPRAQRASHGVHHPVDDFLFEYYGYRPSRLRRWGPGAGVVLDDGDRFLERSGYVRTGGGVAVDLAPFVARVAALRGVLTLLRATQGREQRFGCFGLHEWAMLYRATPDEVRHGSVPLRIDAATISDVVEAQPLRCSHFDAFRFYTEPARPLNLVQLTASTRAEHEQGGCLHATMDLYKWAMKFGTLLPAELIADCFELAREVRRLDMRSSPYDLSEFGFTAVPVETAAGRQQFARQQRLFAARGARLRGRLIDAATAALDLVP